MLKRASSLLLALILALTLSACGGPAAAVSLPVAQPSAPAAASETPPSAAPDPTPAQSEAPETAPLETPEAQAPEAQTPEAQAPEAQSTEVPAVTEDGRYHTRDEVALYIHLYGHLPGNYVTKREAQDLGWTGGSVERYAGEGTAIGGSRFGNYEGLLPDAPGRTYTECDIDTVGSSSRGSKRVVFSNDGLVYYTGDHYQSFELLYGEP